MPGMQLIMELSGAENVWLSLTSVRQVPSECYFHSLRANQAQHPSLLPMRCTWEGVGAKRRKSARTCLPGASYPASLVSCCRVQVKSTGKPFQHLEGLPLA